jgi:hypothetical protein
MRYDNNMFMSERIKTLSVIAGLMVMMIIIALFV